MNSHPDAQPERQAGDCSGNSVNGNAPFAPEQGEAADQHVGLGQPGDDEDDDEDNGYEEYEPL